MRLVSGQEHMRQDSSWSDPISRASSPMSRIGSGEDSSFDSDDDGWRRREARGRSRTPMSEVLSAYYQDGHLMEHRGQWKEMADVDISGRPGPSPWQSSPGLSVTPPEEEMSWTLIIVLLLSVTAVSGSVYSECMYADCLGQLVAVNAEWLVDTMDHLSPTISKEWIGLILLPTVSSIAGKSDGQPSPDVLPLITCMAECVTAINVSVKDQLTLSISVAVGSTIVRAHFSFSSRMNSLTRHPIIIANGFVRHSIDGNPWVDPRQAPRPLVRPVRVGSKSPEHMHFLCCYILRSLYARCCTSPCIRWGTSSLTASPTGWKA